MQEILVLSHRVPYPPNKGEKIRTFNQIKHLVGSGYQVTVLAPKETTEDVANAAALEKCLGVRCELFDSLPKLIRYGLGFFAGTSMSEANFHSSALAKRFALLCQTRPIKAVLCSSSAMAPYVLAKQALLKQMPDLRLVMDFMDLDSDKWAQYAAKSRGLMKWVYRRESATIQQLECQIYQHFDRAYFISSNEVALFYANNPMLVPNKTIGVVGNGLDTDAFYPAPSPSTSAQPVFLFTGVMDYKPNIDAVLWFVNECWAALREHYPAAEFIIAGMNPTREITDLTAQPGIVVTGFVDDILPYFHRADVFIAPFRLARGVQNKILQAFACGVAVVTTPMGAEGIACSDRQHLLLGNTPLEINQAVTELLNNQQLKTTIEQEALSLIQQSYSWAGQLAPLTAFLAEENANASGN